MPFPLRTVAPLRLCRLEEDGVAAPRRDKEEGPAAGLLFGSLEEVCSHSLVSLLWQLSDLSRCATDVFGGIQKQTDSLGRRSAQLQRRLDSLRALATRLDHRKVKIRESGTTAIGPALAGWGDGWGRKRRLPGGLWLDLAPQDSYGGSPCQSERISAASLRGAISANLLLIHNREGGKEGRKILIPPP